MVNDGSSSSVVDATRGAPVVADVHGGRRWNVLHVRDSLLGVQDDDDDDGDNFRLPRSAV
jgi:hypothetical protein